MADVSYGSLPFKEQIAFFRRKTNLPTNAWTDIWQAEHDHAFVVAGANRMDLLADFRDAVDKAIANGETLEQFRKRFDEIVAKHGWSYNGGRNWRSRVIYETNLRSSYAAGRYAQLQAVKQFRPFWQYVHSDAVVHPRPMHLAWNGLVLAADDPWWHTHYPPNGWGCQCTVHALNARDLKRLGKDGPDQAPPDNMQTVTVGINGPSPRTVETPAGVDPGFGYMPGRSAWLDEMTPTQAPDLLPAVSDAPAATDAMPAARVLSPDVLLDAGLPEQAYVDAFLQEFDAVTAPVVYTDVAGEPLVISDALFRDADGALKILKRDRERFVRLYAETIKQPAEIWMTFVGVAGKAQLRRRYIAQYQIEGEAVPALVVFEYGGDTWSGVTAFKPDTIANLLSGGRRGVQVWPKKPEE